ncbi:MAG: DUF4190 domain-containing protein [Gemmataceae bacterium]|nr:DUF4190 domain-containing protein [Gemmataceae bacterium]
MDDPGIQPDLPPQPLKPLRPQGRPEPGLDVRQPDNPMSTLIPYTNPKALIAYYCGVFSLIPVLGAFLGPAALILGILGLRYVGANPSAKGTGHAIAGIVLGAITWPLNWLLLVGILFGFAAAAFR